MPEPQTFLLFLASAIALNVTPGADMLFVSTQAARVGVRHGVVAALGVFSGTLVHIGAAVVGLSALLATSASAFACIKWLGVAYLLYLGVKLLLSRGRAPAADPASGAPQDVQSLAGVWRSGVLVNLLNPKIALFFVAFLPQFVSPEATHHTTALLLLGLTFNITGTLVNVGVAAAAAGLARRPGVQRFGAAVSRLTGGLFIALAGRLVFEDAP